MCCSQRVESPPHAYEAADGGYAADGVCNRHEGGVQGGRDPVNDLGACDARQHKRSDGGREARPSEAKRHHDGKDECKLGRARQRLVEIFTLRGHRNNDGLGCSERRSGLGGGCGGRPSQLAPVHDESTPHSLVGVVDEEAALRAHANEELCNV